MRYTPTVIPSNFSQLFDDLFKAITTPRKTLPERPLNKDELVLTHILRNLHRQEYGSITDSDARQVHPTRIEWVVEKYLKKHNLI